MNINNHNKFKYEVISGFELCEIQTYFSTICHRQEDLIKFYGVRWSIELEDLGYRSLGSLRLPTTRILFTGEEKACVEEIERYRMKFLTAGG